MTTLNSNQIPSSALGTVEKLAAWCCLLLHRLNPTLKRLETPLTAEYSCQASVFTADDGTDLLVVRLAIPLNADYTASTSKLWTQVQEFSNTSIPNGYTTP